MDINVNDLTLAEVAELEDVIGKPMETIFQTDTPRGRTLQALVWIATRRTDPEFTFEDAGNVKVADLTISDGEPNPT